MEVNKSQTRVGKKDPTINMNNRQVDTSAEERSIAIPHGGLTAVGNDCRIPVKSYFGLFTSHHKGVYTPTQGIMVHASRFSDLRVLISNQRDKRTPNRAGTELNDDDGP